MSIYDTLNKEQKEAVLQTEGPLLLLAGAGSGKTRVLTHRIAYLIDEVNVNPWNILAITFTNKAAKEMRERVDKLVGFGSEQIWISTFHSTCVRILRRHIDQIGYDTHFTIYDSDDQKTLMREICKRLRIDTKNFKERSFMKAISGAKDNLKDPVQFAMEAGTDFFLGLAAKVYGEYQGELHKNNALDFDDLIVKTVELFRKVPAVLEQYQERFRYIMVDEYQDTNTAQFELIRLLADKYRNLCVVGDDDQSIYKFRGANIRNILDYEQVYPEAAVIKLEQNYRSTQSILEAANSVIHHNIGRKEKSLWTKKDTGKLIHFRQFDTAYDEADYVTDAIATKVRKGEGIYGDCAVLYRTNAQARLLEERMVLRGIPYEVVGGVNFYARKEIKDILAYLKTINNGVDDMAVKRVINIPKRGIGTTTVDKIETYGAERGESFFESLKQVKEIPGMQSKTADKIEAFVKMIQVFRSKAEFLSIEDLLKDIIETIQYETFLDDGDEDEVKDRMENVEELINKAAAYTEIHESATLSEFLEEIALVADIDKVEQNTNKVLLMTLHSAKGLEFPFVYMTGMEEGVFPSSMASDDPEELEEERRLAYVGITRAKEELTLTCARMRMAHGETKYNALSRFIKEVPAKLMDTSVPKVKKLQEETETVKDVRPKAIVRPRATAHTDKPFIAQGISSLNRLAGVSKGAPGQGIPELDYKEGDQVNHVKYGKGTVLKLEKEPRDYKVTVLFDTVGQKIMYASFAKLKRL
jgi:DNA helicase-2/ATP-dependent DNA helicase PcrA